MLEAGALDAVLTSAPHAVKGFAAIELARENDVFVAAPRIARRVRNLDDLREYVLIEHDRSFPFLRYMDASQRAALKCSDVWFVGSTNTMTSALIEGLGVGIVPLYLARPALTKRRLMRILPGVKLAADRFRLVHRLDRDVGHAVGLLRDALMRTRLD
jgi:DNA-binding transcriptional LysR family regulator